MGTPLPAIMFSYFNLIIHDLILERTYKKREKNIQLLYMIILESWVNSNNNNPHINEEWKCSLRAILHDFFFENLNLPKCNRQNVNML